MEQLFKYEHKLYRSIEYKSSSPIELKDSIHNDGTYFFVREQNHKSIPTYMTKDGKCFISEGSHTDEETFVKNYGNPLYGLSLNKYLWVVERNDYKVSLKNFTIDIQRRVGKRYFTKTTNLTYVTLNLKTGDYYIGTLGNYHKKRKSTKSIKKNHFLYDSLSGMKSEMRNKLNYFNVNEELKKNLPIELINAFVSQIKDVSHRLDESPFSKVIKFYLDKKNIKYPDNFRVFYSSNSEFDNKNITLKELRKNNLNLVDTFMSMYGIHGKKIKKCLHYTEKLNLRVLNNAISLFGEDWVNQDDSLILSCLNSQKNSNWSYSFDRESKNYFTKKELRRAFMLYKNVCMYENIGMSGFHDHLSFYIRLKQYGEPVKWMSSNDSEVFHREHLDWADKLEHYRKGTYKRVYPKYMYDMFSYPVSMNGSVYCIVLLDSTTTYNEESQTQSNCVKGYIGRAGSIVFSVRKGSIDSKERATIEYQLKKVNDVIVSVRVQSLGRFNGPLDDTWDHVLKYLDNKMRDFVMRNDFENVKLEKECNNGVKLSSDSEWNDNGNLCWTHKTIDTYEW